MRSYCSWNRVNGVKWIEKRCYLGKIVSISTAYVGATDKIFSRPRQRAWLREQREKRDCDITTELVDKYLSCIPPDNLTFLSGFWGTHLKENGDDSECILGPVDKQNLVAVRDAITKEYGTVQSQSVVCRVSLNFNFHHIRKWVEFFRYSDTPYEVTLVVNDAQMSIWCVTDIKPSIHPQ